MLEDRWTYLESLMPQGSPPHPERLLFYKLHGSPDQFGAGAGGARASVMSAGAGDRSSVISGVGGDRTSVASFASLSLNALMGAQIDSPSKGGRAGKRQIHGGRVAESVRMRRRQLNEDSSEEQYAVPPLRSLAPGGGVWF
jgi:hypothetical protein